MEGDKGRLGADTAASVAGRGSEANIPRMAAVERPAVGAAPMVVVSNIKKPAQPAAKDIVKQPRAKEPGEAPRAKAPGQPEAAPPPVKPEPARPDPRRGRRAYRRARLRRLFSWLAKLLFLVGVPTAAVAFYVFYLSTPRYVSSLSVVYQSYQVPDSLSAGLVQSVMGGAEQAALASMIYEYVRSKPFVEMLDKQVNLRQHYSDSRVDYFLRLQPQAYDDQLVTYYRNHIVTPTIEYGGYLNIDVQAFDATFAHELAKAIVTACNKMVDSVSSRPKNDSVDFAQSEVTRQEDRVTAARLALTNYQNEHKDIDPNKTASQLGQLVSNLNEQLSTARLQLAKAESYSKENAPIVVNLRNQIAALESEIKSRNDQLTGGDGDVTYARILEQYSKLQIEDQLAQSAYLAAQQGLSLARAAANRKQSYLIDFVEPTLPDHPYEDFKLIYVATTFLASLLAYASLSLLIGAMRDQSGV